MKVQIKSKKDLQTILSIIVDKQEIKKKLDARLVELQSQVDIKGFRKGKVPPMVIKNQFGKAIYGEVVDKILKESTTKAIQDKKFKVAGQPKINLKTFGEGKDLNFELELDLLPEIKLQSFSKYKISDYSIKVDKKELDSRLANLTKEYKNFEDRQEGSKAELGNQIIFDYKATVQGKDFDGSKGNGVAIELGKDLFLKDFDKQLIGAKTNDIKKVKAVLPPNHPKKELANKEAIFECKIKNIKQSKESKLNDDFAKKLGAQDLSDLTKKVNDQISSQYTMALNSITKKEILDQLDKSHTFEIPKNLLDNEIKFNSKDATLNQDKNTIIETKKRIKLGLILNECGEVNNIKVTEDEIKNEIQKQVKSMPGQEKFVFEYYQKNPAATQHLQSSIYEEKVIKFIKSKANLTKKELSIKDAEKMITSFNENNKAKATRQDKKKKNNPSK